MAKKAVAAPQMNKSEILREWFAKQKSGLKWKQSKDEVQAYMEKAGHTFNESSDYQTFIRIGGELCLVGKRTSKTNDFAGFCEEMSGLDVESITAAIKIVESCENVDQAKYFLEKWSKTLELFDGDKEKAKQAISLLG